MRLGTAPELYGFLPWPVLHPSTKVLHNPDEVKHTDKLHGKYELLGRGNNSFLLEYRLSVVLFDWSHELKGFNLNLGFQIKLPRIIIFC